MEELDEKKGTKKKVIPFCGHALECGYGSFAIRDGQFIERSEARPEEIREVMWACEHCSPDDEFPTRGQA
jgi:hypothetical protein